MSTTDVSVTVDNEGAVDPKDNIANMPKYLCVYAWKRTD